MTRPLRIEYENALYHVISRGNDKKVIFRDQKDYQYFLKSLQKNKAKYHFLIHCYCLMNNHYHLLIETKEANLSKIMHALNSGYSNYFNRRHGRVGVLLQGRYKAIVIDKESYAMELSRYIHLNPYRAGEEKQLGEYEWNSMREYMSVGRKNELVDTEYILRTDRGKRRREAYIEFVKEGMREEKYPDVYGGFAIGRERFIKEIIAVLGEREISEGIAFRDKAKSSVGADEILKVVAKRYGRRSEELRGAYKRRIPGRIQAIYLMRELTTLTNREIGDVFGISYTAVSKVSDRYRALLKEKGKERKEIQKLMSHVKP